MTKALILKVIWAPWRVAFITGAREEGCIFCSKPLQNRDELNHIFQRRGKVFGMLNRFPYNSGHLLIAPYRHVHRIQDLTPEEWAEIHELANDSIFALDSTMKPHGYNIGFNVGIGSGAGFEHIHMHIVPRWSGDTNFMPVLADTKVIPEHLEETFKKIAEYFRNQQR